MAPIQRLTRNIEKVIKEEPKNIKTKVEEILEREKELDLDAIIQNASHVLKDKKVLLTYSYSNTVLQVIKSFPYLKVIVPESRPVYEGRILTRALLKAKLKVIFITDAEISRFMEQSDVILVGADRIMEDSLVNKVGTKAIAIMAKEFEIPIYAVCGTDKFLSEQTSPFKEEMKSPDEIWKIEEINGLEILNFYFEKVPLPYFTGIITEQGIIPPQNISKYL